ncbi:hypothetical protein MAF45_05660 [Mesosutterella sp. OilRF-GAM-744-9]|uniref:Uncharacterized protein n=1 Tax=Mesosutterella porci TaxID=2915351 RepID=A0ABS9MQP2_9BURK|nr:hypothetical protein [Mesosutterella sp. oilRF-744-WT-GAM-9]MCG5030931.1 hypothetical protein [Mesosutterella sp. oilRF-744-WT-GAM-9]MCI6530347.1 hypothetical protein [Mesosutterella sp.]
MENDSNDEARSAGQPEAQAVRLSLGDRDDVYQICFAFIENVSEILVSASAGEITSEEAEERMASVNQWLTAALLGKIPGIKAEPGWTGAPLARSLASQLASELSRLPREAQEELSSVEGVLMFTSMVFMHEVQEMVSGINHVPESEAEKAVERQGRAMHELCSKWAERFTGGGRPDIIIASS